ncbi:hypothetical protein B0G81_4429 [Paraburkholderia sp. BL6665CI2N2]|nr:hypothetical protein B0G81_4429 [Paraburkholderia sp. BL6665CI2N2]
MECPVRSVAGSEGPRGMSATGDGIAMTKARAKRVQCKRLLMDSERLRRRRVRVWRIKGRLCIVITTFGAVVARGMSETPAAAAAQRPTPRMETLPTAARDSCWIYRATASGRRQRWNSTEPIQHAMNIATMP